MKMLLIFIGLFSTVWAAQCWVGPVGDEAVISAQDCAADDAVCSYPKFVYGGEGYGYKCGPCPADSKDRDCQECDINDATDAGPCNAITIELEHGFECYDYTLSKEGNWIQSKKAKLCSGDKDTDVTCNMPNSAADKTYKVPNMGCGPCEATTINDDEVYPCTSCKMERCNKSSASTLEFVLAPLLVIIFYAL
ncbi:uncharacterized protein LOC134817257 [Bolinopsis microptera]|uniref:uncharacterized protein LOC134817257 n=1 Tax=Bolinopsis microptera TaxID=2820187 RepID=UPI00307A87E3